MLGDNLISALNKLALILKYIVMAQTARNMDDSKECDRNI